MYDVLFEFLQSIQLLGHKFIKYPSACCFAATSTHCTQPSHGPTGCLFLCSPRPLSKSGIFLLWHSTANDTGTWVPNTAGVSHFHTFFHADGWLSPQVVTSPGPLLRLLRYTHPVCSQSIFSSQTCYTSHFTTSSSRFGETTGNT